jgi:hypothetical protein
MLLTLPEIKDHLRIEQLNTYHDDLLSRLGSSAEAWAANFCNVDSLEEFDADSSPPQSPFVLPDDLKSALLLHVEAMYRREESMMKLLLERAEWLAMPYRQELGV